ncbi:Myb_DNA-bind_4 domain-containing protein [Cephalotus follicularis]|uniref:Myb_DNA-bind_4 domain-containing protein n=1 Tax=Cephalotus follicularis TaxID=3775 RepID=A0A1Q3B0H7_CEPFO|nr:Myb_DNA-bind_4 domain-containing protein [Cephalotus follicularis]
MMEDDEEIHSQASGGSLSPSPSSPNGRITVTVASVAGSSKGGGGGGREDCWSEGATGVLIDAWGERYLELSRGNLKQKHWKEVADIVSSREERSKTPKTDVQCKNRIDTVKKKYKLEKAKMAGGGGPSKWVFFHKLDHLIGSSAKVSPFTLSMSTSRVPVGIPVKLRTTNSSNTTKPKIQFRGPEGSPDSADSLPPPPPAKRVKEGVGGSERKRGNSSVRDLTQAVLRFGEAYEKAETDKLQLVLDMEKQRMKFAKELELQRMQFFMKTQLEISQLKHNKRVGGGEATGTEKLRRIV